MKDIWILFGCAVVPAALLTAFMEESGDASKLIFGGWALVGFVSAAVYPDAAGFLLVLGAPFVLIGILIGIGIGNAIKGAIARAREKE